MKNIRKEALMAFEFWQKPTVTEVKTVLDALGWEPLRGKDNENKLLGIGGRSVRRWFAHIEQSPDNLSCINYATWALLVYIAYGKVLYETIDGIDAGSLPLSYLTSPEEYMSPPKEEIFRFIGEHSLTGLTRGGLKNRLGWNQGTFKTISEGNLSYANFLNLLILCKYPIKQILVEQFKKELKKNEKPKKKTEPVSRFARVQLIDESEFIEHLIFWSEKKVSPFSKIKIEQLTHTKKNKALKILSGKGELCALDSKNFSSQSGILGHLGKLFDKAGIEIDGELV
ncbi:hypothetical protein [uncultured Shewanella sp.]|uniref:hypothetical protein n=1 Tax=uncultured Shewanella sp. TaxID=173975 RepID=UPI00262411B4|nr:hypothetical protein [uncultured Shewanella sp.]